LETDQTTASVDAIHGTTCSFVSIRLHGNFTLRYAAISLAWLREGPMHSLLGQDVHAFIDIEFSDVLGKANSAEIMDLTFAELGEMLRTRRATLLLNGKIYSYIAPYGPKDVQKGTGSLAENWEVSNNTMHSIMQRTTRRSRCEFITSSRLDADDIVAPGFFAAMHTVIRNNYSGLGPNKKPWLGGFFSFREAPNWQLLLGGHAYRDSNEAGAWCRWKDESHTGMNLAAGMSIGQTKALRTNVWDKIGFPHDRSHVHAMNDFREYVVHKYLNDTAWKPKTLTHLNKRVRCSDKNKSRQKNEKHGEDPMLCAPEHIADQDYSRMWLMDVMNSGQFELQPAGIYMLTPLSGHFPWYHNESVDVHKFKHLCDSPAGLKAANSRFSSIPIAEYIAASKATFSDDKFSVLDACLSNIFWRKTQSALFKNDKETCEQMASRLMVVASGAPDTPVP